MGSHSNLHSFSAEREGQRDKTEKSGPTKQPNEEKRFMRRAICAIHVLIAKK